MTPSGLVRCNVLSIGGLGTRICAAAHSCGFSRSVVEAVRTGDFC
jgi:hypothetical protein